MEDPIDTTAQEQTSPAFEVPNQVTVDIRPPDPLQEKPAPAGRPEPTKQATKEPAKTPEPAKAPEQPKNEPEKDEAKDEAKDAVGIDYQGVMDEFMANGGSISEETRNGLVEKLAKVGVPAEAVDKYFRNTDAELELLKMKAYQITGGEEGFQELSAWVQETMSQKERETFIGLFNTSDPEKALTTVQFLHNQYQQGSMTGGARMKATTGGAPAGDLFRNQKEIAAAMRHPDYAKSPTMQRDIQERIKRSLEMGVFQG